MKKKIRNFDFLRKFLREFRQKRRLHNIHAERGKACDECWLAKNNAITYCMKVKSDHHSKFSNLSNWKEEAWKISGLQQDSNPWAARNRCDARPTKLWSEVNLLNSYLPAEALLFFRLLPSNCLKWKIYYDDHSSLSSTTAVQYEFHIYSYKGQGTKHTTVKWSIKEKTRQLQWQRHKSMIWLVEWGKIIVLHAIWCNYFDVVVRRTVKIIAQADVTNTLQD